MKGYGGRTRRDLFEQFDRPALQPLPAERFVHADWLPGARQHRLPRRGRSPLLLGAVSAGARDARRAPLCDDRRDLPARARGSGSIARSDRRAGTPRSPSTCRKPTARIRSGVRRGSSAGAPRSAPRPRRSSQQILESRPHPEQGYRSCLGLLRLAKRYGPARLNAACARAVAVGARSYRHVDSMLKHGLDRQPLLLEAADARPVPHPRQRPRTRVLPRRRALMMTMTRDRLRALRLSAMADAYVSQHQDAGTSALAFDERFSMLVDAEQLVSRQPRADAAAQGGQAAPPARVPRRSRLRAAPRPRSGRDPATRRGPLDSRAPQRPDHRRHGRRQNVSGLCARAAGLSPGVPRDLSSAAAPLCRPRARARGRLLHRRPGAPRARRRPRARRLGTRHG